MIVAQLCQLKRYRSIIVSDYVRRNNIKKVFCISSGNAANYLKEWLPSDVKYLRIGLYKGEFDVVLTEDKYYSKEELDKMFPNYFNASPGALNFKLMKKIGEQLHQQLLTLEYTERHNKVLIPVGSGETIVALSHYISKEKIIGYHSKAKQITFDYTPLKKYVEENFETIHIPRKTLETTHSYLLDKFSKRNLFIILTTN